MTLQGRPVTLGLIQTRVTEDIQENIRRTEEEVRKAAAAGAQIICLQELFDTVYFPQYEKDDPDRYAETIPGETTKRFSELARELGTVIILPIFEKGPDGRTFNSAVVLDADGTLLGAYRKVHIPFDPLFYEKNYFEEDPGGFRVFKTRFADIGILICYDQWFPEAARINALMGAEILFYPTAIGWILGHHSQDGDWHEAWETIQRGHAIANGIHVAAVNRVGEEDRLSFWGGSFVSDPFGTILKKAGSDREETLVVTVDLDRNRRIREGWGFFENRRPDLYFPLLRKVNP